MRERFGRVGLIDRAGAITILTLAFLFGAFLYLVQIQLFGEHFWSLPRGDMLRDFGFFWGGARLALLGHASAIFDPQQFNAWLAAQIAPGSMEPFATWSYPPSMLLPLLPFGLFTPSIALVLWLAGTFGLLAFVLAKIFRDWRVVLALVLSPAALYCFSFGQNGALITALLVGGLWSTDRRPTIAGICFGLLTIKPQLGILLPFALAAGGHWRAFASATITGGAMVVLSMMLFGIEPWLGFWHRTLPHMSAQMLHDYGIPPQHAMPTVLVTLQGWGVPTSIATWAQGLATSLAIGTVIWAWRRADADPDWRNALTCSAVLLATPFAYVYDMMPAMLAVVLLARTGLRSGLRWCERPVLAAVWIWPAISVAWTFFLGWHPVGAFALIALALALMGRLAELPGPARAPAQSYSLV